MATPDVEGPSSVCVPLANRAIPRTGEQAAAVGAEHHHTHQLSMPVEEGKILARGRIPDPNRSVSRVGGDARAVWAEGQRGDATLVSLEINAAVSAAQLEERK